MVAAKSLMPAEALSWGEICARYPNEWVCVVDIDEIAGSIRFARVIGHDPSIRLALDQVGTSNPDTAVVHTWGRPLRTPRSEVVDESRDSLSSGSRPERAGRTPRSQRVAIQSRRRDVYWRMLRPLDRTPPARLD